MGRRSPNTISARKKKLWVVFSRYIRMRDCLETTGTIYEGQCCTCNRSYTFANLQAGHFIPGRMDSILFDPICVHAQCYKCNIKRQGEWVRYFRFMEKKYGQGFIFELMRKSEEKCLITLEWIENAMTYYLKIVEDMEAKYG